MRPLCAMCESDTNKALKIKYYDNRKPLVKESVNLKVAPDTNKG